MSRSDGKSGATTRRSSVWVRIAGGLAALFVVLVIALGAVMVLFPKTAVFAPLRAAIVGQVLSVVLDAPVVVDGPVDFEFGQTVLVTGSGLRVDRPEGIGTQEVGADEADRLEQGEVGLDLQALLGGRLELTVLKLKGLSLAENSRLFRVETEEGAGQSIERRWLGFLPYIIRLSRRAEVEISDATYRYNNEKTGWVFDIVLDEFANKDSTTDGATTLSASGSVNGTAVSIAGKIRSAADGGRRLGDAFTLTVSSVGADIRMRSVVPDDPAPELRVMAVDMQVASIGDTLDAVRVARVIEGTAALKGNIRSTRGTPSLRGLDATVTLENGPVIKASGGIADIAARSGFDLVVDADWPPGAAEISEDEGLLTFDVYNITARLNGDLSDLAMTDGWITTNLFSEAIPRLGPISAEAIRREDDGRLAVEGLRVLAGPEDARTFDLTGRIGDLLQLSDFRLAGDVSIPTAAVLEFAGGNGALGKLTGKFAVSDASGGAGIDTFTASITGSDLVSADLNFRADQSQATRTATFDLAFNVPDYAKLATALTIAPEPVGAIDFKGKLSVSPQSGDLDGRLSFGGTVVTGDLALKDEGHRPLITGKVSTPELDLADLRNLVSVGRGIGELRDKAEASKAGNVPETHRPPQQVFGPRLDVEVSAARIEGGGESVSSVTGRFGYDAGLATAKSVSLKFQKGLFNFDGQMHMREQHRPFSVKGRMQNWPIGDALKEMGIDLPVTGILAAQFNVSSSGTSAHEAIRAARGDLYLRILDGSIGNRMLDLSGLVLPSWLVAESARTGVSRIDCFNAKLDFNPGLAILDKAVVETDDVIVTATGRIDFKADTIDIEATPKARRPNLIPIVSPFAIRGPLSAPKVVVKGGVAGRAVAETLALPFNTLGTLLGVDKSGPKPREVSSEC